MSSEFEKNEEVRLGMRERGDDCLTPRVIDHYAYFPSETARIAFRAFILSNGYSIVRENGVTSGTNRWFILFSKLQIPADIDCDTEILELKATRLQGEYDGWECDSFGDKGGQKYL